ncbi:MAG: DegT/DnrJ/EryC1/StrS family aminotransferase, partial [Marinobacter sp.]
DSLALPWEKFYRSEYMGSGTQALSFAVAIAIQGKSKTPDPEVIIPAYGCPDLVAAVVAQNARPVLVDLVPNSPYMSDVGIRKAITSSTVALVAVGFLGMSERLNLLAEICAENNILLIEDSAQCFPPASSYKPFADCIVLSFGRGKPINLMGGGGLLLRRSMAEEAISNLRRYPVKALTIGKAWFVKRKIFNLLLARIPYYMLEKIPLLGIGDTRFHKLQHLFRLRIPKNLLLAGIHSFYSRPQIHLRYNTELKVLNKFGWRCLTNDLDGGSWQASNHRMLRYPVLAPSMDMRERAVDALYAAGIGASRFYGQSLDQVDGVSEWLTRGDYPVAKDFAARLFTLPTHEDVRSADVFLVAEILSGLRQG